jgi:hypothetical protein
MLCLPGSTGAALQRNSTLACGLFGGGVGHAHSCEGDATGEHQDPVRRMATIFLLGFRNLVVGSVD